MSEDAGLLQKMAVQLARVDERTCRIEEIVTGEKVVGRIERLEWRGSQIDERLKHGESQLAEIEPLKRQIADLNQTKNAGLWVLRAILGAAILSVVGGVSAMLHYGSKP